MNKKQRLTALVGITASAALLTLILNQHQITPDQVEISPQTTEDVQIQVSPPTTTELTVPSIVTPEVQEKDEPETNPYFADPDLFIGDNQGTDQTIQPDIPEKPTYTEAELTNPTQKPSGETVEPPSNPEETPKTEVDETPKSTTVLTPTTPAPSDNMIYVPGFGWLPEGEPAVTIEMDSSGDINKQVGTM